jgi:chromosome segregation ATPase
MKLFTRQQAPGDAVERTPAEIFDEIDAQRGALRARLEAARLQRGELAVALDKERAAYRGALVRAEIDGTPAPSREPLAQLERDLPAVDDRVAGLEMALEELEPEWRGAKRTMLRTEAAAHRSAAAEIQSRIHDAIAEQQAAERRVSDLHAELHRAIDKAQALERDVAALR